MILVDTSVLIDFFKGKENGGVAKFEKILAGKIPWGITSFIYQEILQGAAGEKEFCTLKEYLDTQIFYELQGGRESYAAAAKIYCRCRQHGITVNSTIDLLIVQTAIENGVTLLHNDHDFTHFKKIIPELELY